MVKASWFVLNQDRHPGVSVKAEVRDGRVTIVGLRVERPDGLSLGDLRSIPLPAIEAGLNDGATGEQLVRQRIRLSGGAMPDLPHLPSQAQMRLAVPAAGRYPDAFYRQVAILHRALTANGVRPAAALAEANKVPLTTVHRWIKEARIRGTLAPSRKSTARP